MGRVRRLALLRSSLVVVPVLVGAIALTAVSPASAAGRSELRSCDRALVYPPKRGGYGLIISRLQVRRISCPRGLRIAGANAAGERLPRGWQCTFVNAFGKSQCWRGGKLLTYYLEGSAS